MSGEPREDPLETLFPNETGPRDLAKRVTTALRLLAAEAGDARSPSASVHVTALRREYDRRRNERTFALLEDLLRHVVLGRPREETFLVLEEPRRSYTRDWEGCLRLAASVGEHGLDLTVPAPGTSEGEVAERLLAALDLIAARSTRAEESVVAALWRARVDWLDVARHGCERDEAGDAVVAALSRIAESAEAAGRAEELARDVAAVRLAVALDRCDVAGAIALLEGTRTAPAPRVPAEVRDAWGLLVLVTRFVACGEGAKPSDLGPAAERASLRVPRAWLRIVDAHEGRPLARTAIDGRVPEPHVADLDAVALGAEKVTVLALAEERTLRRVDPHGNEFDAGEWCPRRAPLRRGTVEHEALRLGRAAFRWGGDGATTIVEPVDRRTGGPIGCLRIEMRHRVVPSTWRLASARRAAAALIGDACCLGSEPDTVSRAVTLDGVRANRQRTWEEIVEGLGWRAGRRRWFVLDGARPDGAIVASGGERDLGRFTGHGERTALSRAERVGAVVGYAAEQTFFDEAVVGVCIPVEWGGAVLAWLVVESSRSRDVSETSGLRWQAAVEAHATALVQERLNEPVPGDRGLALDVEDPNVGRRLAKWRRAAREQRDILVRGEPGSGRSTLARGLHRLRFEEGGALRAIACVGLSAKDLLGRLEARLSGTVVLLDLEALQPDGFAALAVWLARRPRAACIATTSPGATFEHPDIGNVFDRSVLRTRPLRERRHEIPLVAEHLLAEVVEGARNGDAGAAPSIDDDAIALLWRQTWRRGTRDLRRVLYAARDAAEVRDDGEFRRLDKDVLAAVLAVELAEEVRLRLPSKDPKPRDLAAAAWCTRTASGRINKSRAGLYLGWDPATVKARLEEAGLDDLEAVADCLS